MCITESSILYSIFELRNYTVVLSKVLKTHTMNELMCSLVQTLIGMFKLSL